MTDYIFSYFYSYSRTVLLPLPELSALSSLPYKKFPLKLTGSSNHQKANSIWLFLAAFEREGDREPEETTIPEAKRRKSLR